MCEILKALILPKMSSSIHQKIALLLATVHYVKYVGIRVFTNPYSHIFYAVVTEEK